MRYLISTDLDGTLLDHYDYSWSAATPAIHVCTEKGVPLIFNTSKTADEAAALQSEMGITGPMIVENGSALILPIESPEIPIDLNWNNRQLQVKLHSNKVEIVFGAARADLLAFINACRREKGWQLEGFNDWSVQQIIIRTGLSEDAAAMAANKAYSEPFLWNDTSRCFAEFTRLAEAAGYNILKGGRFYHLLGKTNKALPLIWLKENFTHLYEANVNYQPGQHGIEEVKLICLGDNDNDVDMLNIADYPVCVRSPASDFPRLQTRHNIIYTDGEGPIGWNESVLKILNSYHG